MTENGQNIEPSLNHEIEDGELPVDPSNQKVVKAAKKKKKKSKYSSDSSDSLSINSEESSDSHTKRKRILRDDNDSKKSADFHDVGEDSYESSTDRRMNRNYSSENFRGKMKQKKKAKIILTGYPCKYYIAFGDCKARCEDTHKPLNSEELHRFVRENNDFFFDLFLKKNDLALTVQVCQVLNDIFGFSIPSQPIISIHPNKPTQTNLPNPNFRPNPPPRHIETFNPNPYQFNGNPNFGMFPSFQQINGNYPNNFIQNQPPPQQIFPNQQIQMIPKPLENPSFSSKSFNNFNIPPPIDQSKIIIDHRAHIPQMPPIQNNFNQRPPMISPPQIQINNPLPQNITMSPSKNNIKVQLHTNIPPPNINPPPIEKVELRPIQHEISNYNSDVKKDTPLPVNENLELVKDSDKKNTIQQKNLQSNPSGLSELVRKFKDKKGDAKEQKQENQENQIEKFHEKLKILGLFDENDEVNLDEITEKSITKEKSPENSNQIPDSNQLVNQKTHSFDNVAIPINGAKISKDPRLKKNE